MKTGIFPIDQFAGFYLRGVKWRDLSLQAAGKRMFLSQPASIQLPIKKKRKLNWVGIVNGHNT